MVNLPAALGKQVGPLPLGAWVAVVGGSLGIAYYARNAMGSPYNEGSELSGAYTPDAIYGSGGSGIVGIGDGAAPEGPIALATITNNDEWAARVYRELIASGYNILTVDTMIRKVLEGLPLTQQEQQLYAIAIQKVGPLPTVPPYVENPTVTSPAKKPIGSWSGGQLPLGRNLPPVKRGGNYVWAQGYRIRPGESVDTIARRFIPANLRNNPAAIKGYRAQILATIQKAYKGKFVWKQGSLIDIPAYSPGWKGNP